MAELTLRNGILVTPTGLIRGGLTARGGTIVALGADDALEKGDLDIDLDGKVVLPGLIDPHTHMGIRDEGNYERYATDFSSESQDAAIGGVTTLVTSTRHGTRSRLSALEASIEAGTGRSYVDFRITASIVSTEHIGEIPELYKRGVRSFKFYIGYKGAQAERMGMSQEGVPWGMFYQGCQAVAAQPGAMVMVHAEDPWVREVTVAAEQSRTKSGSLEAWHRANPNLLEPMQIYPAALVAREAGAPLYVVHISAAEGADLVLHLRQQGFRVTGETLVAFLRYTAGEADALGVGALGKVQPPIRSSQDRDRLWRGLNDGAISCIGTDAVMYPRETRQVDFWDASVGLGPGMSVTLPVLYTTGVLSGRITLETLAKVTSENAARQFGLYPSKGALQVGSDADVVVVDPGREMKIEAANLKSAAGYSIYEGMMVRGIPTMTFLRGRLIAQDYQVVAEGPTGRFVP